MQERVDASCKIRGLCYNRYQTIKTHRSRQEAAFPGRARTKARLFVMQEIQIERTKNPKQKPTDQSKLGFGKIFTDHMYINAYNKEQGWHDPKIVPYQPITLEPSAMVFHYGQEMFEGLKAYKAADGRVLLFRPDKNIARANRSNDRLCIPEIPEDDFLNALKTLVSGTRIGFPPSRHQPVHPALCHRHRPLPGGAAL